MSANGWRPTAAALAAGLALSCVWPSSAAAASPSPQSDCLKKKKTLCTTAGNGGFGVGASGGSDGSQAGGTTRAGGSSGSKPAPTVITQRTYVPTCSANTPYSNGLLCGAAVESCPTAGDVQFWVFTREFSLVSRTELTPYTRVLDPSTVCLGPEDPVLDPAVAIPAIVQRDFQRVVVVKGVAEVSPKPDTLVNIPTVFTTATPRSYDIPLTILGQSVVIAARAERYTWHLGDGAVASTTAAQGRVEHEYRTAASRQARVDIEWSGSFRVNGGPAQPIAGTVTTTGEPITVEVKQARSELVRD